MLIHSPTEPTLEGIPTEILILILFQIPDQASLQSFVYSSPICHQAYLAVRQRVLYSVVKTQYGALLDISEAIIAVRSEGILFKTRKEEAIALLDSWRRKSEIRRKLDQDSKSSAQLDEPGCLEETIKLFRLFNMLSFFHEDYMKDISRPAWAEPAKWRDEMSCIEKSRFLRALCRLQTLANIFGISEIHLDLSCQDNQWDKFIGDTRLDAYRLFYATMPPWEYEEMGCIWSYMIKKYETMSKDISHDIRKLVNDAVNDTGLDCWQPFFILLPEDQQLPSNPYIETVDNLDCFKRTFSTLAAIGPWFLYRVLHSERLLQRDMVFVNAWNKDFEVFIGIDLDVYWGEKFPFIYPADRHAAPNFEQLWPTLPPMEQPNLGWKKAWILPHAAEEELQDALNYDRDFEEDWEWGYALWDDKRLEDWRTCRNDPGT